MIVEELIEELKKIDPKRLVVMYLGGEEGIYSPLDKDRIDADNVCYKDKDIGDEKVTKEDEQKYGFSEEFVLKGGEPCVVFYAKNWIGQPKEPKKTKDGQKRYDVRLYTTIGEGDDHEHPMGEFSIYADNLGEVRNIVKEGYIEIQDYSLEYNEFDISGLKNIKFKNEEKNEN